MQKIKIKTLMTVRLPGEDKDTPPGTVVEVDPQTARDQIRAGRAEAVADTAAKGGK